MRERYLKKGFCYRKTVGVEGSVNIGTVFILTHEYEAYTKTTGKITEKSKSTGITLYSVGTNSNGTAINRVGDGFNPYEGDEYEELCEEEAILYKIAYGKEIEYD